MLLIVRGYIPNNYDMAKTEIVLGILEYIVTFPSHTINYKVLLLPKYLLSLLFLSPLLLPKLRSTSYLTQTVNQPPMLYPGLFSLLIPHQNSQCSI